MKRIYDTTFLLLALIVTGCSVTRDRPKYSFSDGYYNSSLYNNKSGKVYVDNTEESIMVYPLKKENRTIDSLQEKIISFPQQDTKYYIPPHIFRQTSFDFDFLTIPFKYRPETSTLPRQFNTNLNGAVYLGYRTDVYRLWYKNTPINNYLKQTTHYGFSFGFFTGFGGTAMNPTVTNNQISAEYDGVVWSKGIAGIVGIDNFTIGLALGWDNLLDKNKTAWIYQGKPWLGLAFGLNLN